MLPAGRPLVVVVGSINVDLVVRVERLPATGETVMGGAFSRHHGGKSANQAVAAARMGADVRFVGAIGDDEAGDAARTAMGREGIDVSGLHIVEGMSTGVALIVVDRAGENQIAVASGANAALDGAWVTRALASLEPVTGASGPATGVMLLALEIGGEPLVAAVRRARELGLRLVVDPAPAGAIPAELLAARPIMVPNLGEAERLAGVSGKEQAARALEARTGAPVIVTLGEEGALVIDGGRATPVPGFGVRAIDATGAGDTVCGVLAAEMAGGRRLLDAVRTATAAAALSVTVAGAREGMPDRSAVKRFLASRAPGIRAGRSPRERA